MSRERVTSEHGSVIVAGLLLTLATLMLIGAAVDTGRAFSSRRTLAALAEEVALSGSQELDLDARHRGILLVDTDRARSSALAAARELGVEVSVTATREFVHVRVRRRLPTVLLRLAGLRYLDVSATAVAAPREPP